jgi:hypothetical protein
MLDPLRTVLPFAEESGSAASTTTTGCDYTTAIPSPAGGPHLWERRRSSGERPSRSRAAMDWDPAENKPPSRRPGL